MKKYFYTAVLIFFMTYNITNIFAYSTPARESILETLKYKYNPEVEVCKKEEFILNVYKEYVIKGYADLFSEEELMSVFNEGYLTWPRRACNEIIKPIIISAFNHTKLINLNTSVVISEFQDSWAKSGESFYSQKLKENVGVVDSESMILGINENYKFVIKVNKIGEAYLLVNAGKINAMQQEFDGNKNYIFMNGRYAALSTKNTQTAKIGNTYFLVLK